MKRWLETRPVVGFVLLAYGISYVVGGPALLVGASLIPESEELLRTYAPRLLVVFGPGLAALILAHVSRRDGGAAGLLRRLVPQWTDVAWAGAVVVVGTAASAAALFIVGVDRREMLRTVSAHWGLLAAHAALQVGIIAIGEELGWRGWLLPRMAERTNRLRATAVTAGPWGLWHGPLLFAGAPDAAMFLLMVFGLSALLTWLWSCRRGHLFVVIVAHAMVNAPLFFWEQAGSLPGGDGERLRLAWYALEAIYAAAGLVLIVVRWRWWTQTETRGMEA
jgi:uncharacterized protein